MKRLSISALVLVAFCFACNSHLSTRENLVGTWQEAAAQDHAPLQFQFAPRTVIKSQKRDDGMWQQLGGGPFRFVDAKHLQVLLFPNPTGPVTYEVAWQDRDHVQFRTAEQTIQLARVKP